MLKALPWVVMAMVVVIIDQWTKQMVSGSMAYGASVRVTDWFNIVLVHNPGAAFSFLSDAAGWQRWFFIALALAASLWITGMLIRNAQRPLLASALSLVLGGAAGNAIDRVNIGAVVDFVQWHWRGFYWPAFNVADSAITLGVILLILHELRTARANRTGAASGSSLS